MADRSLEARKKNALGKAIVLGIAGFVMILFEGLLWLGIFTLGAGAVLFIGQYLPLARRSRQANRAPLDPGIRWPKTGQTSNEDRRSVVESLRAVVNGDPLAMPTISTVEHHELAAVAHNEVDGLVLTRTAVIRVLEGLLAASWTPEQAQVWASFATHSYAASASMPLKPLDIEFDKADEDRIVEVLARLNEIGDLIDGHVSTHEQHRLLKFLREP